jgi:RNA polymerase sigma-70 factor (ECF subfamily)
MTPLLAQGSRVDRSFERLYRRHVADVYHYALAVLRNPSDAEDVAQTTFLNAYRAYQRGERPQSPQNWLIAIAHNVCRQRFRQSARRPHEVSFEDDVADAVVDDEAPSAQDIRHALGHLAFNQRAALVMRELEGRTYAEIGEILGLSVSAVETLIFRARRALREQLEGSLTCGEAERAISRQVDGRLPRAERGALRAHLRECPECATFARSQRAVRGAFKALGAVPLPMSLSSFSSLFGGGGAAVGTAVAAKAAAVLAAGALVGGVGYEGAKHSSLFVGTKAAPAAKAAAAGAPAARREAPQGARGPVVHPKVKPAKTASARGGAHGAKAAAAKTRGAGLSKGRGSAKASAGRGASQATRAQGSPARGGSTAAPGQTKSSSASVVRASYPAETKGHATAKPTKPKLASPSGRSSQTGKLPKRQPRARGATQSPVPPDRPVPQGKKK